MQCTQVVAPTTQEIAMNKRVSDVALTAALASPDDGVSKPGRTQATSAITQIAALDVGHTWSRCEPVDPDLTIGGFGETTTRAREELRSNVASSVRHAKTKTGGTYSIETGDFISTARNIYLVAVVTRVE
jgi:hypothetical protein